MYRLVRNSNIPKILKLLIYILLTLSCIYWIGWFVYKFLSITRKIIHWCSDERNWWTFIVCILILVIGSLIIAQFFLGLQPFERFIQWIVDLWNDFIDLFKR